MEDNVKISIVVPTYGRLQAFKKLCNSILTSNIKKENFEICVVSSDDKNSEKIKWLESLTEFNIKIILEEKRENERKKPLNYFENLGIKNSSFEWILVCNDDMWFEYDWYENFLRYLNNSKIYLISSHIGSIGEGLRIPLCGKANKNGKKIPLWLFDMTIIHKSIYEKVDYLDENIIWYGKGMDLSLATCFMTDEEPTLCHNVKINHDIVHELRIENQSDPNKDFQYIRKKWDNWIIDNCSNCSYVWI